MPALHYSPNTRKWEHCVAHRQPCPYGEQEPPEDAPEKQARALYPGQAGVERKRERQAEWVRRKRAAARWEAAREAVSDELLRVGDALVPALAHLSDEEVMTAFSALATERKRRGLEEQFRSEASRAGRPDLAGVVTPHSLWALLKLVLLHRAAGRPVVGTWRFQSPGLTGDFFGWLFSLFPQPQTQ